MHGYTEGRRGGGGINRSQPSCDISSDQNLIEALLVGSTEIRKQEAGTSRHAETVSRGREARPAGPTAMVTSIQCWLVSYMYYGMAIPVYASQIRQTLCHEVKHKG